MFRLKPGIKSDPVKRWNLPERVFFACGACHILAYAFLEAYPGHGFRAVWIRPAEGFTGNHVFVTDGKTSFDFHGYRHEAAPVAHHWAKGRLWWPGWDGTLVPLPQDVLISEAKSKTYDGLWLREPGQFLHDALPRARTFLARFGPPVEAGREPLSRMGEGQGRGTAADCCGWGSAVAPSLGSAGPHPCPSPTRERGSRALHCVSAPRRLAIQPPAC